MSPSTGERPDPSAPSRRTRGGLTLLEVLAAFLIFSIVFTVLVGTSQTAVHGQGVALRRLEASAIADEVLADLEVQIQQKQAPVVGEDVSRDLFEVSLTSSALMADGPPGAEPGRPPASGPPDMASLAGGGGGAGALAAAVPELAPYLLRYDVEVRWSEAEGPRKVVRTTFAFDWERAAMELADLFQASGSELAAQLTGAGADGGDAGAADRDGGDPGGSGRDRSRRSGNSGTGDLTIEQMREMVEAAEARRR